MAYQPKTQLPASTVSAILQSQPFPGFKRYEEMRENHARAGFDLSGRLGISPMQGNAFLKFFCAHLDQVKETPASDGYPGTIDPNFQLRQKSESIVRALARGQISSNSTGISDLLAESGIIVAKEVKDALQESIGDRKVSDSTQMQKSVVELAYAFSTMFNAAWVAHSHQMDIALATTLAMEDFLRNFEFSTTLAGLYVRQCMKDLQKEWVSYLIDTGRNNQMGLTPPRNDMNAAIRRLFS